MPIRRDPSTGRLVHDNHGHPQPPRWVGQLTMGGPGGAAPADATYLVLSANGSLTAERVFAPIAGQLVGTDGGAGNPYTLGLATTAVTPGAYGSATAVATFTVDSFGRLTVASSVPIVATPAPHDLLSPEHADTLPGSPVAGDLVYANTDPRWAQLPIAAVQEVVLGVNTAQDAPVWRHLTTNNPNIASWFSGGDVALGLTFADVLGYLADPASALGIVVKTGPITLGFRTLQPPAAGLAIGDPDGVAGDPTFALANDLAALEGLVGTGYARRTGVDTWTLDAGAAPAAHNLLSASHGDTVVNSPTRGSLIVGNATPAWDELVLGTSTFYLRSNGTDALWAAITAADITAGQALTRVDDTNVTLTLGGTPATALLTATSLTLGWTGQLSIARGGTGQPTALAAFDALSPLTTRGDLLTRDATNNVRLAVGASPRILQSDGTDPSWVAVSADATLAAGGALTLATVNATVGTFGSATQVAQVTVNAKGLTTAVTNVTVTPAASSITGGAALTRVDDTNVTVTLGGTPATALLAATSLTLGWTGLLGLARGGTAANLSATGGTSQVLRQSSVGAAVTVSQLAFTDISGSVTDAQVPNTITLDNLTQVTTRSHSSLQDLVFGDDHTQYVYISGRAGSANNFVISSTIDGRIDGSLASGGDLELRSTSHATKGQLRWNDSQLWWEDIPDFGTGAETQNFALVNATLSLTATSNSQALRGLSYEPVLTLAAAGFNVATVSGYRHAPTITMGANATVSAVLEVGTYTNTAAASFGGFQLFNAAPILASASAGVAPYAPFILAAIPRIDFNSTGTATLTNFLTSTGGIAVYDAPTIRNLSTGTFNADYTGHYFRPALTESAGTLTIAFFRGLWVRPYTITGTPAVTEHVAVEVDDLTQATLTTGLSLRSAGTAVQLRHAGPASFGANAAPTNPTKTALHCAGAFIGRRATFSNVAYTIDAAAGFGDYFVAQTGTMTASRAVTLPASATAGAGRIVVVVDESGSVTGTNTLVVTRAGADTINGATTQTISTAYGVLRLMADGTAKWTVI